MSYTTKPSEARAKQIEKELTGAAAHWLAAPRRVSHGNAGEVAVETAATLHADLIVVGRRGSGLVRPALLGSTVGTVLYSARCPVLVVTNASADAR